MDDEEMLVEMRKQYEYATLETHMLVDGVLYQRCRICMKNPIIIFGNVLWCDDCIDEFLATKGHVSMTDFIASKRKAI
jgi:hypothetical protein